MKKNMLMFGLLISILNTNCLFSDEIDNSSQLSMIDLQEPGLQIHSTTSQTKQSIVTITDINNPNLKGKYNTKRKKAYLLNNTGDKVYYTNVVEYSIGAPPQSNDTLKPFALTPNPKYTPSTQGMVGDQLKNVTLYGIKQDNSSDTNNHPKKRFHSFKKAKETMSDKSNMYNNTSTSFEITGLKDEKGRYNSQTKTAYLINNDGKRIIYTNIIEYSQAVTPPTLNNPSLVNFATMPNPQDNGSSQPKLGGQKSTITLYGIPQNIHIPTAKEHAHSMSHIPMASNIHPSDNWTMIKGLNDEIGFYNHETEVAYLFKKIVYTNVIEHQSTHAPISDLHVKQFATMENNLHMPGILGSSPTIELYGIEQDENQ